MATCSVCNASVSLQEGKLFTADKLKQAVARGFGLPERVVQAAVAAGLSREQVSARWQRAIAAQAAASWLLCPDCAARAQRYLAAPGQSASAAPARPAAPGSKLPWEETTAPATPARPAAPPPSPSHEAETASPAAIRAIPSHRATATIPSAAGPFRPRKLTIAPPAGPPAEEQPPPAAPPAAPRRRSNLLPIILGGIVLLALIGGAFYLFVLRQPLVAPAAPGGVVSEGATPTAVLPAAPPTPAPPTATPTPTPDLAGVTLRLEDLPGFVQMTASELAEVAMTEDVLMPDPAFASEARPLNIAGFSCVNQENIEFVTSYLIYPLSPLEQVELDRDLGDPRAVLDALGQSMEAQGMFQPRLLEGLEGLGDNSMAFAAGDETGRARVEMFFGRRGPVVIVIYIAYPEGQTPVISLRQLAEILDARVAEALGGP